MTRRRRRQSSALLHDKLAPDAEARQVGEDVLSEISRVDWFGRRRAAQSAEDEPE